MPGSRLLLAALLLGFFAACDENTPRVSLDNTSAPTSIQSGLVVNITHKGDTGQYSDKAKIYVFLRKPGTRMPLVVEQVAVSELPERVVFARHLQQSEMELVTRLSPDGKVNKSANDIEVITPVGTTGHSPQIFHVNLGNKAKNSYQPVTKVKLHLRVSVGPNTIIPRGSGVRIIVQGDDKAWPVAIRSLKVQALPMVLTFTDLDATGLQTLSSSKKLTISAMIYQTGTKTPPDSTWKRKSIEVKTANVPELVLLEV